MRSIFLSILFSGVFLLNACGASDKTEGSYNTEPAAADVESITDTKWMLHSIAGEEVGEVSERGKPHLTLDTAENRVYGFGGCNSFNGGFTLGDENAVSFTQMASTKMYCEESMSVEDAFLPVFESVVAYEISGNQLHLKSESGEVLAVFIVAE